MAWFYTIASLIVIGLTLWLINDYAPDQINAQGVVTGRRFEPSYTTYQTHGEGKRSYTVPVQHAEEYKLIISISPYGESECEVSPIFYEQARKGDKVEVYYVRGYLFKNLIIKSVIE